ncbi:BatD family protein [Zhouia spongiae]|uniref:BatD family protein n=1 Tax=Zhouia spongiae TaxID=2202721 RepID=A0ABY3YQ58_9FLAO|nr:BatD family protein [Zhouia spongiae]UNY99974.1 BatD family protein [Zhouia spongiae]
MDTIRLHTNKLPAIRIWLILGFFSLGCLSGFAQTTPKVTSNVDSTSIKIGEQIQYKIQVETDTTAQVMFPDGQTFAPMEVVEASPVDSIIIEDKLNLIKKYALTKFDSGTYNIPVQTVLINKIPYLLDSLKVKVANVAVDTTKQKMYDIKPLVEVEKNYSGWWKYIFYAFLALTIIGGLLYWFVFREKPLTREEKEALLPPYERAILELKKLDESKFLIQSEYKAYYSQLTNIVRSYLEEDVHITALESTTDELIGKLEMLKDAGNLDLDGETIVQFKKVLETADLVKFARSTPENAVIENDRKLIENIVVKTKEALPEPTEEELLQNEEYLEELARKKQKRKLIITAVASLLVLGITISAFGWYYGFGYVKDTIVGHPTKELAEREWIRSEYGFPPVSIETPKVLKRIKTELPAEAHNLISSNQIFGYGSMMSNFYITASSTTYKKGVEFDGQKAIDATIKSMEQQGAKNIILKDEEISTPTNKKGLKVYGSMQIDTPGNNGSHNAEYVLLNFTEGGGFQQVLIVYNEGDTYAGQIVERIINSIDFKTGS